MDVDYVISYRFAKLGRDHNIQTQFIRQSNVFTDRSTAISSFEKLVEALSSVGLQIEVRDGDAHSVLLFVRVASEEHLFGEVYRSR